MTTADPTISTSATLVNRRRGADLRRQILETPGERGIW